MKTYVNKERRKEPTKEGRRVYAHTRTDSKLRDKMAIEKKMKEKDGKYRKKERTNEKERKK